MVRIVSVSTLGYGDYGGVFSDREVDGVDYTDPKDPQKVEVQDPKTKTAKTTQLKGGRRTG